MGGVFSFSPLAKLVIGTSKAWIRSKEISYSGHTHSYAPVSHNHSASNITSGILPIERGGIGVDNIDELKELLGITVLIPKQLTLTKSNGTVENSGEIWLTRSWISLMSWDCGGNYNNLTLGGTFSVSGNMRDSYEFNNIELTAGSRSTKVGDSWVYASIKFTGNKIYFDLQYDDTGHQEVNISMGTVNAVVTLRI